MSKPVSTQNPDDPGTGAAGNVPNEVQPTIFKDKMWYIIVGIVTFIAGMAVGVAIS